MGTRKNPQKSPAGRGPKENCGWAIGLELQSKNPQKANGISSSALSRRKNVTFREPNYPGSIPSQLRNPGGRLAASRTSFAVRFTLNIDTNVNYYVLLKVNESAGGGGVSLGGDAVQVFADRHVQANRSFDRKLKIEFQSDLEHRLSFIDLLGYNKTQPKKSDRRI
ncbi:hypothetical protein D5086_029039 [Populus alba]|uniref:Uncharacterized protein n=1 Tax=Populus alba TaxID=43335 RepID=A0ACC4AT21_POPAL